MHTPNVQSERDNTLPISPPTPLVLHSLQSHTTLLFHQNPRKAAVQINRKAPPTFFFPPLFSLCNACQSQTAKPGFGFD